MSLWTEPPSASLFPDEQQYAEIDPAYDEPRVYAPRKPHTTVLYKLVQENLETWLSVRREACLDDDPIPAYVEKAFRAYMLCGIWSEGVVKFACVNPDCADPDTVFVALSCKTRGLCPSCGQKYMVKTAMHLEANVLPRVPYRQLVVSFPKRVRYFLQDDARRFRAVLRICMRAIEAKVRACSPGAPKTARMGAVLFPQGFGASLNAHPHGHVVCTDGVFALDDAGGLTFYQATGLDDVAMAEVHETIRKRVLRFLVRTDCLDAGDAEAMLSWEHSGFSVDGSVELAEHDRAGLARLTRYCARHPFAKGSLGRAGEDQVVYRLPKPDVYGRTVLSLSSLELLDKLAALIIPPRVHRNSYWGAFAPHSAMRPYVVLTAGDRDPNDDVEAKGNNEAIGEATGEGPAATADAGSGGRASGLFTSLWGLMLAKVYEVLPIVCRCCGQEMKPVAVIVNRDALARICNHQGQPTETPKLAPARSPPQGEFEYD